ncbi:MAG: tetratricopeptide repeat protein [Planctomycetes bacterium]|nr:tetratricopeptide repeat protein [Planctomycetota bacterium]
MHLVIPFLITWILGPHDGLHERIAFLTKRIEARPNDATLWLQRASLYREHRDFAAARADLDRAERLDAQTAGLDLERIRWMHAVGEVKAARERALGILQSHPERTALRCLLVEIERTRGAFAEALDHLEHVIERSEAPQPDLFLERARLCAALGNDHLGDAVRGLDEAMERIGPAVSLQLEAITLQRSRRRFDDALERLDRLRAPFPRQETWLARRGDILVEAGRRDEARVAYRAALQAIEGLRPKARNSADVLALRTRTLASLEALGDSNSR